MVKLKKILNMPLIFSSHPRLLNKIKNFNLKLGNGIIFCKPFGFFDYAKLMKNAKIVLSDSGSITEETSILSIPSVNIRSSNERQEGMEKGTTIMTGLHVNNILNAANIVIKKSQNKYYKNNIIDDYAIDNVSDNVISILQSYIHYINKKTWFKF